ncbi:hypothetical protein EJ06DRAFT_348305 [Trichodelitschia bisporula]|uniref:Uncharacterized protein n=1 Tax=Trichodelitschia bisporula TaxID=703511 RepID=A0A6G1I2V8_9PEZI|nr:hypothetical protein EJ06DRAFT_348305 [Trichodelitschia bisporula]
MSHHTGEGTDEDPHTGEGTDEDLHTAEGTDHGLHTDPYTDEEIVSTPSSPSPAATNPFQLQMCLQSFNLQLAEMRAKVSVPVEQWGTLKMHELARVMHDLQSERSFSWQGWDEEKLPRRPIGGVTSKLLRWMKDYGFPVIQTEREVSKRGRAVATSAAASEPAPTIGTSALTPGNVAAPLFDTTVPVAATMMASGPSHVPPTSLDFLLEATNPFTRSANLSQYSETDCDGVRSWR